MKHPISQRTVKISALNPVYGLYRENDGRDIASFGIFTVANFNMRD